MIYGIVKYQIEYRLSNLYHMPFKAIAFPNPIPSLYKIFIWFTISIEVSNLIRIPIPKLMFRFVFGISRQFCPVGVVKKVGLRLLICYNVFVDNALL